MHTQICIGIHIHKNTHAHLWHCPNTLKNCYWDSQSIHKYAYTYIYTLACMYMHTYTYTYTQAHIYIYTCHYTYIHAHIYTHIQHVHMHACKLVWNDGVARLRGKTNLTSRSSTLLPICGGSPFVASSSPIAFPRGMTDTHKPNTTNNSSSHHHDSALSDHNHSSALVHSQSTQFMACTSCEPRRRPHETRLRFHFGVYVMGNNLYGNTLLSNWCWCRKATPEVQCRRFFYSLTVILLLTPFPKPPIHPHPHAHHR